MGALRDAGARYLRLDLGEERHLPTNAIFIYFLCLLAYTDPRHVVMMPYWDGVVVRVPPHVFLINMRESGDLIRVGVPPI